MFVKLESALKGRCFLIFNIWLNTIGNKYHINTSVPK